MAPAAIRQAALVIRLRIVPHVVHLVVPSIVAGYPFVAGGKDRDEANWVALPLQRVHRQFKPDETMRWRRPSCCQDGVAMKAGPRMGSVR